jgi:YidC/Oxa1 family membrane protein insertase
MFDRTTWIAVSLSIAGLIAWQWYYTSHTVPAMKAERIEEQTASTPSAVKNVPIAPVHSNEIPQITARRETVDTAKAEYIFENNIGGIESITLFLHLGEQDHSLQLNHLSPCPIGALLEAPGKVVEGFSMNVDKKSGRSSFEYQEPKGLMINKFFTLPQTTGSPEEYLIGLDITFCNTGSLPIDTPSYLLAAGGATPVHFSDAPTYTRFDFFNDDKMTTIDVNWFAPSRIPLLGTELRPSRPFYQMNAPGLNWTAVTSQYFCTILTAQNKGIAGAWATRFETPLVSQRSEKTIYGMEGGLQLESLHLAPGESVSYHFTIFAGPKDFKALEKLGAGQQAVMNFGMFHLVSEFLLWAMNALKTVIGNYAAAIIVLTLLIKSALWPIQNKATNSMRRMKLLSPKMTELREKYKDNPTKMNEELMKLYKHYGVNPFGGCLPMLVQIPIFFGFYSMLGTAIELRNSHFLWIHDLSQPDTLAHFMNIPINLLPIIMAGTMLWQMSLSPKGGDPAQQRVMYLMPIVFLSFCYNFASALALYWTTQNIFSIIQLYLTRNSPLPKLDLPKRKKKK